LPESCTLLIDVAGRPAWHVRGRTGRISHAGDADVRATLTQPRMPCSCVRSPGDKGSTTRRRGSGAQDRRRVSPSSAWDRKPQHDL